MRVRFTGYRSSNNISRASDCAAGCLIAGLRDITYMGSIAFVIDIALNKNCTRCHPEIRCPRFIANFNTIGLHIGKFLAL